MLWDNLGYGENKAEKDLPGRGERWTMLDIKGNATFELDWLGCGIAIAEIGKDRRISRFGDEDQELSFGCYVLVAY